MGPYLGKNSLKAIMKATYMRLAIFTGKKDGAFLEHFQENYYHSLIFLTRKLISH